MMMIIRGLVVGINMIILMIIMIMNMDMDMGMEKETQLNKGSMVMIMEDMRKNIVPNVNQKCSPLFLRKWRCLSPSLWQEAKALT